MKLVIKNSQFKGAGVDNIHIVGHENVDLHIDDKTEISDAGRHNVYVNLKTKPAENKATTDYDPAASPGDDMWYKKPIGQIGIGVATMLIGTAAVWCFVHYFG